MRRLLAMLLVGGVVVLSAVSAFATTIHVPAGKPTIQAAIDVAVPGDTVRVGPGTYFEHLTITNKAITIISSAGPQSTFLSKDNGDNVLLNSIVSDTFELIGFTILTSPSGRGVASNFSRFRVENCDFISGGVTCIHFSGQYGEIVRSTFRLAQSGAPSGGVLADNYGTLVLTQNIFEHCVIAANPSALGDAAITNNTFDHNSIGVFADGPVICRNNIVTNSAVAGFKGNFGLLEYNDSWNNTVNYDGAAPGIGSISLDPLFTNPDSGDFTLQSNSPCRDAGDPSSEFNDLDGTRNDMGGMGVTHCDPLSDLDCDGIPDSLDNCVSIANWNQEDGDGDGKGDVCDDPLPEIVNVSDVPNDQGGLATVRWRRSHFDVEALLGISQYSVWRATPWVAARVANENPDHNINKTTSGGATRMIATQLGSFAWEQIGSIVPHNFEFYAFTAPTLYDSSELNDGRHYFLVSAHSMDGLMFWDSAPDSGYSVDNLAPPAPLLLAASLSQLGAALEWNSSIAPDVQNYRVYRDTASGVVASPGKLVGSPEDTTFLDETVIPGVEYFYRVSGVDFAGNEGALSNEQSAITCHCDCHADYPCEGVVNILDVAGVIEVAFRNGTPVVDPNSMCPYSPVDVNCDNTVDILDVARVVNVAFRNGNPASEYCEPCSP